jgi:hypothetical protein
MKLTRTTSSGFMMVGRNVSIEYVCACTITPNYITRSDRHQTNRIDTMHLVDNEIPARESAYQWIKTHDGKEIDFTSLLFHKFCRLLTCSKLGMLMIPTNSVGTNFDLNFLSPRTQTRSHFMIFHDLL